MTSVIW